MPRAHLEHARNCRAAICFDRVDGAPVLFGGGRNQCCAEFWIRLEWWMEAN